MVAFRFNAKEFFFRSGIDDIGSAYKATIESFERKLREYDEDEIELLENVKLGIVDLNRNEGLNDADLLQYHRDKTLDAISLVRKIFLFSLYHYWKQCVQDWMCLLPKERLRFNIEKAFSWLEERGQAPDREYLRELRNLVNLIKHGTQNEKRFVPQHLFKEGIGRDQDDLQITGEQVVDFFLSVRRSGLKPDTNDW